MNILIVCSQKIEGDILKRLIEVVPEMNVSGWVSNLKDLKVQAPTISTDLVLVEWDLLAGSEETIQYLHTISEPPSTIAYGRQQDWAQEALAADLDAYFWIGQGPKVLLTMIYKIWLDRRYARRSDLHNI